MQQGIKETGQTIVPVVQSDKMSKSRETLASDSSEACECAIIRSKDFGLYYGAKAAVLAGMKLFGRPSNSILGGPQVLAAPTRPYRMGKRYWRRGPGPLWEMPIATTPLARFPFLGSFIILAGKRWTKWLYRMWRISGPVLVLELHGMDFIDGQADGLEPELWAQPDVRVSWKEKRELFMRLFEWLRREREILPLYQIAGKLDQAKHG